MLGVLHEILQLREGGLVLGDYIQWLVSLRLHNVSCQCRVSELVLKKGLSLIKVNIVFKESTHRQKFNVTFLFPVCRHQYLYQFSKNIFTSLIGPHM